MTVQPGLCQTWSETPKTVFLASGLIYGIICVFCLAGVARISCRRMKKTGKYRDILKDVLKKQIQGLVCKKINNDSAENMPM